MIRESSVTRTPTETEPAPLPRHRLSGHYEALFRRLRFTRALVEALRVVGVTSSSSGEGVSTVAANLAVSAARGGCRVLLVDANTRNPSVARTFQVSPRPGLVELLVGEAELEECIHETNCESLSVLAAGPTSDQDASGIDWSRLGDVIDQLKEPFELVIFDLPAADELSPGPVVASLLDGVLMVVEAERTGGDVAARAKRQLERAGAKLLGVVLNKGRS